MSSNDQELVIKKSHTIPVPRFYKDCSKILEKYCNKGGILKHLLYETKIESRSLKRIYGILCNVVGQYKVIDDALKAVSLFEKEPRFKHGLAFVLTSEILTKDGPLLGDCKPVQIINAYEKEIRKVVGTSVQTTRDNPLKGNIMPKYARVNTLIQSNDSVCSELEYLGWKFIDYDINEISYEEYLDLVENLDEFSYTEDCHIRGLLVFSHHAEFWKMEMFKKGGIIVQNKASCLPVFVSDIKPGDCVMDACAAPGNKTSQLANLMSNQGRIVAVDKDYKRFMILRNQLEKFGVECAETLNCDFTYLKPDDYKDVKTIIVDPSCSASGTNLHMDEVSHQRIIRLSNFQSMVLKHALSFPQVETVVYSTCSVNEEENEAVVKEALELYSDIFDLEDLSQWMPHHPGLEKYEFGKCCLRTIRDKDKCEGFFVAKFIRRILNVESYGDKKRKGKVSYENSKKNKKMKM